MSLSEADMNLHQNNTFKYRTSDDNDDDDDVMSDEGVPGILVTTPVSYTHLTLPTKA